MDAFQLFPDEGPDQSPEQSPDPISGQVTVFVGQIFSSKNTVFSSPTSLPTFAVLDRGRNVPDAPPPANAKTPTGKLPPSLDDIRRDYWRGRSTYDDQIQPVATRRVAIAWANHVMNKPNYAYCFQPLRGTERERYKGIMVKSFEDECWNDSKVEEVLKLLERAHRQSYRRRAAERAASAPSSVQKRPRGRPRKNPLPPPVSPVPQGDKRDETINQNDDGQNGQPSDQPSDRPSDQPNEKTNEKTNETPQQVKPLRPLNPDEMLVKGGLEELKRYHMASRPYRHEHQQLEFPTGTFETHFGDVNCCLKLNDKHWFMGFRPGDPIFRVVDVPRHPIFGLEDLHHHPVFGAEDLDLTQLYFRFRYEGMVPFSFKEARERFAKVAFPAFITIIVAILSFDPQNPEREEPELMKEYEEMLRRVMNEERPLQDDTKVGEMVLLATIWKVKFPEADFGQFPHVFRRQIKDSLSRFGEVAWLICKLFHHEPDFLELRQIWAGCEWFMLRMTGANVMRLANYYCKYVLAKEAQEQVREGDMDDVMFYRSSKKDRPIEQKLPVLAETYDREGPNSLFPQQRLHDLEELARKLLSADPAPRTPKPKKTKQPIVLDDDNDCEEGESEAAGSIVVRTNEPTKEASHKRKRPAGDEEESELELDLELDNYFPFDKDKGDTDYNPQPKKKKKQKKSRVARTKSQNEEIPTPPDSSPTKESKGRKLASTKKRD